MGIPVRWMWVSSWEMLSSGCDVPAAETAAAAADTAAIGPSQTLRVVPGACQKVERGSKSVQAVSKISRVEGRVALPYLTHKPLLQCGQWPPELIQH